MKKEIQEKIDDGYVYFTAIIEMVGKPQKHIEKTIKEYIENIKKNKKFDVQESTIHDAIAVEDSDSLYSTFAEITVLVQNYSTVYDFVFEYMPASIEIMEPEVLEMKAADATGLVNDFIAKFHQIDMTAKQLQQKYNILAQNLGKMIENSIFISIRAGGVKKEEISQLTGIAPEQLEKILTDLVAKKKLIKTKEEYAIVPA
jgi:CRP-like cAMP-binding protein